MAVVGVDARYNEGVEISIFRVPPRVMEQLKKSLEDYIACESKDGDWFEVWIGKICITFFRSG